MHETIKNMHNTLYVVDKPLIAGIRNGKHIHKNKLDFRFPFFLFQIQLFSWINQRSLLLFVQHERIPYMFTWQMLSTHKITCLSQNMKIDALFYFFQMEFQAPVTTNESKFIQAPIVYNPIDKYSYVCHKNKNIFRFKILNFSLTLRSFDSFDHWFFEQFFFSTTNPIKSHVSSSISE